MQPVIISVLVLKFADQVTNHTRFRFLPSTMHFPAGRQPERKYLILQNVSDWTISVGQWSLVERTASIRANTIVPTYVINVTAKSATVHRPSVGSGMRRSLEHPSLHLPAHFTSRLASLARVSHHALTFLPLIVQFHIDTKEISTFFWARRLSNST